jgi:hypothetical protein
MRSKENIITCTWIFLGIWSTWDLEDLPLHVPELFGSTWITWDSTTLVIASKWTL